MPRGDTQRDHRSGSWQCRNGAVRMGLAAQDEVVAAAPTPSGRQGLGARQAEEWGAGSVSPQATTAEPRLKLSALLDPALDPELGRLPLAKVREMFASHVNLRGAEPSEDIGPTVKQVSAIHQVITAGLVPFADFSLFGPHGKRLFVAQAHSSQLDLHA